jgi:excisionase family DNA binding protein
MTNDMSNQDARVTQAAIARLPRHAAVGTDRDAARMHIRRTPYLRTPYLRTLYLRAHSRVAERKSHRNGLRQAIPPLRGGKHPPLGCPTSDVTVGGEGMDRLLSVNEAAEVLGTSVQFPRKLIAQRRIRFVRVGRLVRIPESAVREYIETRTVEPVERRRGRRVA